MPDRRAAVPKSGPKCLDCGKGTFTRADGKLGHDKRAAPVVEEKKPEDETPPKRDHFLNKRIGGGKPE